MTDQPIKTEVVNGHEVETWTGDHWGTDAQWWWCNHCDTGRIDGLTTPSVDAHDTEVPEHTEKDPKSDTVAIERVTYLVMVPNYWGHGDTVKEAKVNCSKAGGDLRKKRVILQFPRGTQFLGVDGMGGYRYRSPDGIKPETIEQPAKKGE